MIKHIVAWRLKEFAEGATAEENAVKIRDMLMALKAVVPGIVDMEVGININKSSQAYDAALYSSFETPEDLESYLSHPSHLQVSAFVAKVREGRVVVDYRV